MQKVFSQKNTHIYVYAIFALLFLAILWPQSSDAATISRPQNNLDLVGYWSFDIGKESTSTIYDLSGNANHATLTNATGSENWISGKIGTGVLFDGADDHVAVPHDVTLNLTSGTGVTVSAWFRLTDAATEYDGLVMKASSGLWTDGYGMYFSNDAHVGGTESIGFFISDWDGTTAVGGAAAAAFDYENDTDWHHVAGVWDENTVSIYLDGVLGSVTDDFSGSLSTNSADLLFGKAQDDGFNVNNMPGVVDEVRTYTRALSKGEVERLFKLGRSGGQKFNTTKNDIVSDGLVAHWTFDGNDMDEASTTAEVLDRGPNSLFGNELGDVYRVIGKHGQALEFDTTGSADHQGVYILNGNDTGLMTSVAAASVSFWFKLSNNPTGSSEVIFDVNSDGAGSRFEMKIIGNNNGKLGVGGRALDGDSFQEIHSTFGIPGERWYHAVGIMDYANGDIHLYIDGVLDRSSTTATFGDTQTEAGEATDVRIGQNATLGNDLDGTVDDVRVYERILTQAEITALYEAGAEQKMNISYTDRITDGLIGYWTFDGPDMRSNVADVSGNSNNGTLEASSGLNATSTLPGVFGQALNLDGDAGHQQHVLVSGLMGTPADVSICMWVNLRQVDSGGGMSQAFGIGDYIGLLFDDSASDAFRMYWYENPSWFDTGNVAGLIAGTGWHHACGTFDDAANEQFMYKNGVQVGSNTRTASINYTGQGTDTRIGRNGNYNDRNWDGLVDDVRIYDRALTADEVSALYNMGR